MNAGRRVVLMVAALCLRVGPAAGDAPPRGFAVEPYLLELSSSQATVAFHLHQPMAAQVIVRSAAGSVSRHLSSTPRRGHRVRVSGLSAGQVYTYEVLAGKGQLRTPAGDRSYQIRTSGRPGESFSFAVYGDPRPGENLTHRQHRAVVARMLRVEPAFCLVLGDMVDDGSDPRHWEAFFAAEAPLRRRSALFAVRGDNDHAGGKGLWSRYLPDPRGGYYRFQWGGVYFFGMSTYGTSGEQPTREFDRNSEQLRWLVRQLSQPEVKAASFRVVFMHDPIYISRGSSSEVLRRDWGPLLARHGVDVVFASFHLYERSMHQGVAHVITGGAGAELVWLRKDPAFPSQAEARRHHFCRVDVKAGTLQLRAIAADGSVLDSLTLFPRTSQASPQVPLDPPEAAPTPDSPARWPLAVAAAVFCLLALLALGRHRKWF